MKYDAITLDTNIFRNKGWNLEGGILGQLTQFKEGSVEFVLSEIVVREIHKYLKIEAQKAQEAIKKASRESRKNGLFTQEISEQLDGLFKKALTADNAAKQRLQTFADMTGMRWIPAENADVKELILRYFKPSAPFETSGNKKNEFPDAIALLSLEKFAESEQKKILAISKDTGWVDFAKSSKWLDIEEDLAKALQILQQHTEEAMKIIAMLLSDMGQDNRPALLEQVTNAMSDAVNEMNVYPEASSAYRYEADWVFLYLEDFQFIKSEDGFDFTVVQIGNGKIVAQVGVNIQAKAECQFTFSTKDPIDKDYFPIGSTNAETEVEFDASVLFSFEGNFSSAPIEITLSGLELAETIDTVDFDFVDIDYSDDVYDDDYSTNIF